MMDGTNISRTELMKKLQQADFYVIELQLYLNTHPNCKRALSLYDEAVRKAKEIRKEYEASYGPITATSSTGKSTWQWSKGPWTWETERS